jgi:hypothetical protein
MSKALEDLQKNHGQFHDWWNLALKRGEEGKSVSRSCGIRQLMKLPAW